MLDDDEAPKGLTPKQTLLLKLVAGLASLGLIVAFGVYALNYHSTLTGFEGCARIDNTHVRVTPTKSGPKRSTVITFTYGEEYCEIDVDILPEAGAKVGDRLVVRGVHSRKICTVTDVIGPCVGEASR